MVNVPFSVISLCVIFIIGPNYIIHEMINTVNCNILQMLHSYFMHPAQSNASAMKFTCSGCNYTKNIV